MVKQLNKLVLAEYADYIIVDASQINSHYLYSSKLRYALRKLVRTSTLKVIPYPYWFADFAYSKLLRKDND